MAEDVLVTYKVGESIYQIPASNQEKLLEKYPDAERMSTFNYGGEDYYIPNQNAEKFISKYPDAEPMDNDANIFMQSYRGKQNRGIPTITVTEGEENGLTSTLAESEDVSQKPKASNGDIATPQPVNDTFFKEDAATQQQNIAKDKKDRAIAEQIYNTFESKPELFKTVEAREKFYDLLASKGYANAFSIGESMVSGDSRFDQRDEKESYIPNAGIDYVIGRRRHDDIVNTPVMRDPAVQLKLHTTFTNAGEGLQQTINTLNAGGDNEQQRSMAKDFSLLQTRLSSIQKAEKEGRINTQGAKDAIKNLSDAAANIRKKYKNYIDGVTEEGEQKKTFEEKITGESIEGKKDFAGISLDTKPTQQKVKGLSKDAREKVLSTLDDIESLYKKFSSVSAQSNAAYVNRPENQYQLATALSEMGKFKESNKILGELLNKNAASYQIYQAAAYNYYQLGDNAAARSMQIAAQQRQPISDIPSNEGGDTTGLDMGLGNPANPQYGNQGSPTPASEEMGLIAGALRHYTPLYSNAANISEGWMHALEKLKKGGIDYSKLQQAKNFGDVVKLGVGEGARTALNTIAGFAEGLFAYSMNTTPVGLAFVEGTQGLTAEGAKATIGKVGAETFNYFRGLKGSDKVTPDEAVAAIMMPVTTVLQGKEMRGAEIPEWAKDVGLIADVIAMHLFMGAVSRLRGTEEAKTAQDILDGKEVTVEHANNLIYSIIKMTNEEGGVIYKIQHEYAEKLKELEKTVADFPETREVLQPEIEATNKKLEDIQGTLLHHDILTESSRVEIQGKEKALSALKDAIEKQKEGSAAKPLLEERARQLQEEIDGLEAERVQKTKDAVDAHTRESFAKLADEVLDIRFGDYVDYGGIKGRVERRPDGVVVVTPDGKEVLVEGGFSGKRLKDLGLKKIEEPKGGEPKGGEPKTEPQPETEVEQGVAEVKAPDVKFNFEENTVTVDGKKYTYDGVGVDKDGNTTSIRVIDENGNVRHLRNEEVVFEIELQKETAELGMIEKSEVEAAAKELNIKEQKNEKETRGTPEKQQGVVEKLQPAEQAKAVEENKGEQKQEQLKTQDDAVQEQKTKGVDVRQQAADGEAVGERNAKGQEITDKGEAEKIKKQIAEENAKSEWQKEQEAIDNDSSLSEEEKEKKKIESTAKALDDKYFEDKRVGKQKQLELIDLIPKEQVDNPSTNGFYRVSKMDENLVSKQSKEAQENIKKLNDIFKEKNREDVISEAYHKAKKDGSNPELVKAVEELLSPKETKTEPTVQEKETFTKLEQPTVLGKEEGSVGGDVESPKEFAFSNHQRGSIPYKEEEVLSSLKSDKRTEDINGLGYLELNDLLNDLDKKMPKDIVGNHLFDKINAVIVNEKGKAVIKLIDKDTGKISDKTFYTFSSIEDAASKLFKVKENHRKLQLETLADLESRGKETELTKYGDPVVVKKALEELNISVPKSIEDKIKSQSQPTQKAKAEQPTVSGEEVGSGVGGDVEANNIKLDDWHSELKKDRNVFWHGSPSGDMRGSEYGLHIGSHEAAKQALEARIGVKADGTDWNGTEEYGKTKLAGKKTLKKLSPNGYLETGFNSGKNVPEEDYYPSERKEKAKYSDGTEVAETSKPNIQPVRIKGEMSNSTSKPHEDFKANALMKGQLKKGTAKRGYYYENVGEDAGSISAVVPSKSHIEIIENPFKEQPLKETLTEKDEVKTENPALASVESTAKALEGNTEQLEMPFFRGTGKTKEDIVETSKHATKRINEKYDIVLDETEQPSFYVIKDKEGNRVSDKEFKTKKAANDEALELLGGWDKMKAEMFSEAYHKAKKDGSNPELVKAVEELIGKPKEAKSEQKQEKPTEQKPTIEQQVKTFGVAEKLVKPVVEVANALFSGLKKAGLVAKESVEDWLNIGKSDKVDRKALKQIIGEVGAENLPKIKANLDVARQMEAGGKTPKEIWLATGWERSKDKGKWKYDLPDFLQGVSDLFDLEDKRDGEIITNAGFVVSSELRKAYPQLDNIHVRINISRNNNPRGSFERVEINGKRKKDHDQINVYARDVAEAQSILIHEIQHAIQDIEGFARGGDYRLVGRIGAKRYDKIQLKINQLVYKHEDKTIAEIEKLKEYQDLIFDKKIIEIEKDNPDLVYKILAGEVEARNTQKRLAMTPEQRREQMLSETEDVAEDSKIYIYGANEVMESRKPFGGNSGYVGYSMSRRAAQAYDDGKLTYSKLPAWAKRMVDAGLAKTNEWHHTSSYGNETPFYNVQQFFERIPKELKEKYDIDNIESFKDVPKELIKELDGISKVELKKTNNIKEVRKSFVEKARKELNDFNAKFKRFTREKDAPKFGKVELSEMEGKYGWFNSKNKSYNLPEYHSGIDYETKENYDKARELETKLREAENSPLYEIELSNRGYSKEEIHKLKNIGVITGEIMPNNFYEKAERNKDIIKAQLKELKELPSSTSKFNPHFNKSIDDFLTEKERQDRQDRHYSISEQGENFGSSYERRLAHEENDANYREIALERYEKAKEEYLNSDEVKKDEAKFNEEQQKAKEIEDNIQSLFTEEETNAPLFQQDKAQEEIIKVNGKELTVRPINAEVVNGFYSPIENAVHELKQAKGSGEQMLAMLKQQKGVKADELKWTGVEEWLKGQKSVTKEQILDYMKNNRVQIMEVVKTNEKPQIKWNKEGADDSYSESQEIDGNTYTITRNLDGSGYSVYRKGNGQNGYVTRTAESFAEADQNARIDLETNFQKTKYSQYQLAGEKENYKEVLVTFPQSKQQKEINRLADKYGVENTYISLRTSNATDSELEFVRSLKNDQFKSSHFDEPNILVHLRMNTRTDAEGKKVLFLEEVQSDWGQKGKKEGFLLTEKEAGKAWEDADNKYADFMQRMEKKYGSEWEQELTKDEVNEEGRLLDERENTKGGTISKAPFVTDTNAWTKLGLKVALKEAVKQGADKIAWTTGEQQNDRYDLSKQVEWINAEKTKKGDYKIEVGHKDGRPMETLYLKETELEANLGKELATKIVNDGGGMYKGLDLQVGGSGMKGFYGSPTEGKLGIVGNVAKSLFKQEPKTVELDQSPSFVKEKLEVVYRPNEPMGRVWLVEDNQGRVRGRLSSKEAAEQEKAGMLKQREAAMKSSTQHSIDITPELKAAAEKGMPLFQNANAQYRIKAGEHIVEALKDFDGSPKAVTAIVHEFMHPTVVEIFNGAKEGNETGVRHANTIVEEYNKANPSKKVTLNQMIDGNDSFINGRTTPEYRAVQEFIAEAWEKYHHEGAKGFSKAFQEALDAITEAFRQVYKSLTGVTLTPELRKMFDELLGMEEVKQEQKQEKPAIEKTLVEEHGVAKEDAAIVTSVLDKLNKGLQSMGVSFDITKGLQLGKGKEGSEASAHAQFRIDKGKRIVEILKSDLPAKEKATAVLHEVGHLSLHELLQQHIDGSTPEIKKALDTMIKAFNESGRSGEAKKRLGGDVTIEKLIEEHNAFKEQGEKINAASTEALSDNIPNFRDFHEFITDSLNKYLKDGTAGFGKEFDAVLQKIKELLVHVYDTVRGGTLEGLTVSPELKQVFDRMLGKDVDLFKEPEKPQAKPLGEVKVDMPTTDEQGRVMSLSEALRMAKEQGQIKGKETGGLKHSEGMSEADFVAMYQKQQQDNLRAELLGAEDVDVAHTAGEERISQRQRKWKAVTVKEAKKIIEGLDPKYESTNAESVNSLVDRIFAPFQDYIKAGVDVFDVASEYAKSIYPKDRTEPYAAQKAAVATVLMTKAANELRMGFRFADSAAAGSERGVFKRGTLEYDIAAESLKKFEDYLSGDKRVDATALAFANSHINPNEVYALLDAIDNSRKKVMGEKAKSGRTKEEVAKEMRTLKPTAEEVDTAAEKATAKTTKVKPKRSLFSGSTTKKTRSTISVERKKSAKDKLKSGLSKIQAAIPSAKPTPKKGGLTEEPPLPKGVVEGVKDIAEAAISEGHYTQEAIKDYVAEKTKGILDRATSDGIIDKAWDGEIKQKSGAARADEVSYAIVKALKTGKGDAITKQLGEALLMQDAEYDPSSKTKRQQATARLAEILKDPAAAEARLNAAINMVVNQSIVNPKMLDYLGLDPVDFLASKENPHGMTMEQFEAFSRDMLKKKLYDMAQDFMGHGVHEQRVLPLPKKRIKPSASEVKKFIKDFYDNPEMTDSMLETALTDHFDITPEQATAIASKVRGELADIVASRSQKKIDALAEEISDGDRTKKKRVTDMVVKALTTNGAFGDIPFSEKMAAALSNRSVAPADINKILAYGRMANATDSSLLKAFYMRKAATILSKYDMSAASFLFQGLYEQGVVNILGNPRTSILTASLSMLKTMPFDVARMFVTRPSTFVRAVRFSKLIGSKGIGSVTGEGFRAILNGVETVRNRAEIETKPQIRRESANKQARLTSWRYLRKASLSGNDPKRAQLFILKALQSLTFSGGSLRQNIGGKTYEFSPTHWLVNLISGLDVVVKAGLMNLHNYYNAERFIRESGIKFGTSEFTKKMSEMLTTDPLIFDAIDKQVNMEVADAMKNGIPLPKDYVHERKTQLYQEYVDKDVVSQSLFEINKSALIGIPRTWLGAHTYNFIRSNTEIKDNEKTVNAAVKYIFGSALYFSRVGINVIERRGRGIPFYNMFLAAAPYEFTIDASGKVVRRTTESGKVIRRVENKRDFAFGILQATTTTALAVMLINNIFQQEDLKDEKGNPVIDPATGEPVKHWVLNPSSPIRFHGRKKALTTTEKNAVPAMCIELTNVEDPDKRFWKFEWFPESWYPMLFMLGEESDDIRYKEEKLQVGGTEKDNSMLRYVQEEPTSMFRIVTTAGIGAFNASFTTPAQTADEASRLISQDKKRDAAATIAYRLTGQPFITTVNPRLAGQIADAYDYFKEREKTYVKLSIENTNIRSAVSNMAQYSMNQVWAGRYLVNNEDNKYTIYDAHGQPMEREPGDLLFLPAMFSEDMYYGWAEHIYKSPLYKIYMDDNGNFDESVIAIPNRIGWNDKVSVSDMVKQQVRQKTREYYGQLVTKFYGKLLSTPYEERGEFIKELWKAAVNEAKTEYGAKEKTVEGAVGVMQRKNMTDGNAKEE